MSNSNGPGPPLLSLSLTPLPSPNVDDGARSRLWMCPLDMHDARLRSGATVALSRDSAAAAHAVATASKPLSRPPLWPLSPPPSSASSSALLPGSSIVLADAWPGPKLPRGKASPSRALAASLGLFQRREGSGGSNRGGGRSFSSSPAPPDTTDGVAVSLLAPPTGADADDYEASELVLRPLQEEEKEEENPGPRQLAALSALAARRAAGRSLLRGNVLAVPLLGRDAPLEVVRVVVVGSSSNASRRSLSGWEAARVGPRTKVRVVAASGGNSSGGDDDDNSESESESESEEDEDAAAVSPSSALHYGSDEDPLVAAAASAAAKAAERAVGGGPSGPAASAAAAAAAAGARALRGALFRARAASCTIAGGFAPLGGVDALAERLRGLVALPLCRPEAFPLFGLRAPAGAVLHGPPGTGKTALAVAAAADAALALEEKIGKGGERGGGAPVSLFVVGGAEVVRSAAGASEAGLRGIFAAARAAPGPSMVFLDEVDALAPARGGGGGGGGGAGSSGSGAVAPAAAAAAASGASARLSSALAAELDAVSASSSPRRVVVLAATNRLEAVDQALRRPGRLDAEVEVPPPGAEARAAILRSHLGRRASPASSAPAPASSAPAPASSDPPGTLRRHSLTDRDVRRLADAAHGFVGADLALLVREAASVALRRAVRGAEEAARRGSSSSCGDGGGGGGGPAAAGPPPAPAAVDPDSPDLVVSRGDFDAARRVVRPSAMRSVVLRLPRARWGDVGGQGAAKARLQEALQTTRRRPSPSSAADPSGPASATDADATSPAPRNPALLGVAPPAGILLYGPPGCSKTLLARAAARESGRNLFAVKAGELLSCYVGDSERAVASLFKAAKAAAPSLVFFDEVDGLAPRREAEGADGTMVASSTNEASARVVAQLLLELDAVAALADRSAGPSAFCASSSSAPSSSSSSSSSPATGGSGSDAGFGVAPVVVVAATNRPDRVDPALLRPGRLERRIHVGPPVNSEEREQVLRAAARRCPLAADVELRAVAEATGGFTGADLAALVRSAATLAAEEGEDGAESVGARHFAEALRTARPSRRVGGGNGDEDAEAEQRVFASFSRPGLG